eukprot:770817_1
MSQKQEASIEVPSTDPSDKKEEDKNKDSNAPNALSGIDEPKDPKTKSKKKGKKEERELSAEDEELKNRLEELVKGILDKDYDNVARPALNLLTTEIRTATASMTSVPKPLKFLKNDYEKIKTFYNQCIKPEKATSQQKYMEYSDLMSILAMTMEEPQTRLCLKYRLESDIKIMSEWGTQYLKHLAAEIRIEMETRLAAEDDPEQTADLVDEESIMKVVDQIVEYYMDHNAEGDAIDLLLEVERKELIKNYCKQHNHRRVCEYLRSCASFLPPPDDIQIYKICFDLYLLFKNYYDALRFALKLDDKKLVRQVMRSLKDRPLMKRQCAYLLGWHQFMGYDENEEDEISETEMDEYPICCNDAIEDYEIAFNKVLNGEEDDDKKEDNDDDEDEDEIAEVNEIIGNHGLSEAFHTLARDLDVLDPKDPEQDIFKEQIVGDVKDGTSSTEVISARKSLAISYVNAFVNAGYGRDKFMMSGGSDHGSASVQTANDWIAKNKERGQLASVASIGTIMLWDEEAANCVDRYFESNQSHIRAGAYLAIGISCSGMKSESGMGLALLSGPALNEDGNKTVIERLCAILGLGLSYAGQNDSESQVFDTLGQLISTEESDSISSLSALCLGYVYVGTCSVEICNIILSDLMERDPATLNNPLFLLNVLGLALLFLGKQQEVDVTLEAMDVFDELNPKFGKTCKVCLECLAYAGTGNVLKIQKMLGILGEHFDDEFEDEETKKKKEEEKKEGDKKQQAKDDDDDENEKKNKTDDYRYYQSIATLGISIIALGEDLGSTMCLRMFNHLIQYGNIRVKRAVPLALAMISVSNPLLEISDTLSKLSHDHDEFVSRNAIFALGIIGAGTNNARIARMLRSLTQYYGKEPDHLYMIRIAQGLIHLGKGLLTIKCFHSDRFLLSKVSICGILTSLFCNIGTSFPPKEDPSLSKEENTVPWSGNTISLLSDFHYLLYTLNLCIKPRMLITLDALNLKPLLTTVRVGQALDTVGQAGKNPKRITGFQTHETPILLQYNDRAILAQDTFVSVCSVLEGFAILRKNPESEQEKKKRRKQEKEKLKANKNQ